jgi:methylmalonyl-CoA mutase N-terminal domain/subunit
VVGVNQYEVEEPAPAIFRPSEAARAEVLQDLVDVRAARDSTRVAAALEAVRDAARGSANLMDPILAAVSVYATLGEVCTVLEKEFGRYQAPEVL